MEFTEGVRFDSLHLSPEIIRAIEKRNVNCLIVNLYITKPKEK